MTAPLFTRAQWFSLPMALRDRWWRETDYSRLPPPDDLKAAIAAALAPQQPFGFGAGA